MYRHKILYHCDKPKDCWHTLGEFIWSRCFCIILQTHQKCGVICNLMHFSPGCLSAVDMVEFNPAIGTEEEVIRTAKNTMKLIQILLGMKSHLDKAPLPPVDDSKVSSA